MATAQEISNPFASGNDVGAAEKAAKEAASNKMLHDSQAAKPLPSKEKATLDETEKLARGITKYFTDAGATPAQAKALLNDFFSAKDNAGRAKVFSDSNVAQPQIVTDYEAKYGNQTTNAIRNSRTR
jgi:hypothetical protein